MRSTQSLERVRRSVDTVYRDEGRRIFSTLVRLLGDLDLAEDALHDAIAAAMEQWPEQGVPANPRAWLVSVGRFKAIDAIRRSARVQAALPALAAELDAEADRAAAVEVDVVADDQLRLIFTCCHPALSTEAQVALTLREVCGLSTDAIAHAYLTSSPTIAQRIVRAKAKIRSAGIPFALPSTSDLPSRLDTVLQTLYLVFNEGYSASSGEAATHELLAREAIRLARLLVGLLTGPETLGLLALMLLQDARRAARVSASGEIVLLEQQDRSLWNREAIEEGSALVEAALRAGSPGPYAFQAAIAAVHAEARDASATDWDQIVGLYDLLARVEPTEIVQLNRAVAVAMRDGPESGLTLVDTLLSTGVLDDYYLAHAARADLCRRLGRRGEALASYERALVLTRQEPERRFLQNRIHALA